MTDSPRRTQNRSRVENYYPISKRNIGGTAMKSRHGRLAVSDMVKMYSPPNSTAIGNRTAPATRKWPPVATAGPPASGKPPPTAPKPGGLSSHAVNGARPATAPRPFQSENKPIVPKWKMEMENRKAATSHSDKQEENRRPSWGQKRDEPEEKKPEPVLPWKQKQQDKAEVSRPKWGQPRHEQKEEESNLPAWKLELLRAKQETEKTSENAPKSTSHEDSNSTRPVPNGPWRGAKPPPHPSVSAKPTTVPWSQRNRQSDEFLPPPPPSDTTDNLSPKRCNPQSRSFTGYQTMPKPTTGIEKSSGSFGSSSPKMTRKNNESPAALSTADTSPQKRVNSFLHTGPKLPGPKPHAANGPPLPPPSAGKPQKSNGVPRRLPIPEDKYYEPPPLKTSKPPNVVLPSKGRKKLSLPSLPGSLFSRPSLPSRDVRAPPPVGGRDLPAPPPSDARNHPPPPLGPRDLPLPPPMGARDLPHPLPIGARDLPLPPPTGSRGPPHSPNLPPLPSRPTDLPPDLPSRPLPSPLPGKMSMPLPVPPIEDEIYDDPVEALPPRPQMVPPPMVKRKSSGLIPTWSDEEDEAVYDETPDEPPARPQFPVGFPTPGAPPLIPEDADEMYEDVEEYMRLKKIQLQQQQQPANESGGKDKKEKDKKKKDSEKREKDVRKKFTLPMEGDILAQGQGFVKKTCKGSGKNLGVTKDERIDIIRMTDNPKGQWLIRNIQGKYGYVESDHITIDVNQLRQTFGVGGMAPSGMAGGPPLPPGIIPTTSADDDDAIYDQTADEDIYEEV